MIRTAVVGVGALGEHHARIHSELPEAELVAVVDLDLDRAQAVAEKYGCRAVADYRGILDEVQAISLAVPTIHHSEVACEFLEAGRHVLVEKPISHDLETARQMIASRDSGGAVLHVGQSERFNPAVLAILPYVSRPLFFEAHRLGAFVPRSLDIDVVLDLMIHDLDLVLSFVDSPVQELRASGIPILTERVDIASARIEFENGCVANLTASRVSNERVRKLRFFQPAGYVSLDLQHRKIDTFGLAEKDGQRQIVSRPFSPPEAEPLKEEIRTFLATVADPGLESSACTAEGGLDALGLALSILGEVNASLNKHRHHPVL